tara:strand:+ start:285 stop:512 length:228 start_codon:yes stop_codon:yes gene_type:complete
MELKSECDLERFIRKNKYLVVFPDKKSKLYKSLRDIEGEISVAASTISKKLKESNSCICQSRGTEFYFFIQLVNL